MRSLSAAVCEGGRALEIASLLSASLKSRFANVPRVFICQVTAHRFVSGFRRLNAHWMEPNHAKKTSNRSQFLGRPLSRSRDFARRRR